MYKQLNSKVDISGLPGSTKTHLEHYYHCYFKDGTLKYLRILSRNHLMQE